MVDLVSNSLKCCMISLFFFEPFLGEFGQPGVDSIHHKTEIITQIKYFMNYFQGVDYRLFDYLGFVLVNKIHVHFVECYMKKVAAYPDTLIQIHV